MEIFDVYNKFRQKTGKFIKRGERLSQGDFRQIVQVLLYNQKGQVLIQKRAEQKETFPGLWTFSAGGSVIAGESSWQGAQRELAEEIGIQLDFSQKVPFVSVTADPYFVDYYLEPYDGDLDDLLLQETEVSQIKWADFSEVWQLLDRGQFVPSSILYFLYQALTQELIL